MTAADLLAPVAEHRLRSFDGTMLRWFEAGRGYPILVSLPIGLHRDFLLPLIESAGDRYRFIYLQSRGLWGSEASANPQNDTVEAHGRDLADVAAAASLSDYAALGYCGGSAPLVIAAGRAPVPPRRLLLLSTLFRRSGFEEIVTHLADRLRASDRPDTYRMILHIAFRFGAPQFRDLAIEEICSAEKLAGFLAQLSSLYRYTFPVRLAVTQDITIAVAQHDIDAIRTSSEAFLGGLDHPDARLIDLDEAGHFLLFEDPRRVAALLDRWLAPSSGELS